MVADASDILRKNGTVRLNGKVNGIHRHTNGHRQNGHTKKVTGFSLLSFTLSVLSGDRYVITDRPILPSLIGGDDVGRLKDNNKYTLSHS